LYWITLDDTHTLFEFQKQDNAQILIDAVKRNSAFSKINLKELLSKKQKFLIEPDDLELRQLLRTTEAKHTAIISFRNPQDTFFGKTHPFTHLEARGEFFPFRKSELDANVPKEKMLESRLGFRMIEPNFGFESVAGMPKLKDRIGRIRYLQRLGIKKVASAFFMFGVAGAGKTYISQAIAKELGMKFGYLDLPHFMSLPSPTKALDELFDYLQSQDTPCVLLIDEIEKMFDFEGNDLQSKNVFGKLLTRLNDIYNDKNNKILFIATANDISKIVKYNPEFLRKGRFNELFFANYPKEDGAMAIISMYLTKSKELIEEILRDLYSEWLHTPYQMKENGNLALLKLFKWVQNGTTSLETVKEHLTITLSPQKLFQLVENAYSDEFKVSSKNEFIYSPPEIKALIEELQYRVMYDILSDLDTKLKEDNDCIQSMADVPNADNKADNTQFMRDFIRTIVPLQISARDSILRQISQSKTYINSNIGGGDFEIFITTD